MTVDDVVMPEDYRALLAESGPGTLAGVLRLLAPDGPQGFDMGGERESLLMLGEELGLWADDDWDFYDPDSDDGNGPQVVADARLWGVFTTGETCWWLPIMEDPAGWPVLVVGHGWQQLNISTTEFLRRWTGGLLDLPVLAQGAVRRDWRIIPAGQPASFSAEPETVRDPLAQLKTLVGPGRADSLSYDWAAIEADLGRPLPPDFKLLHETFGRITPGGGPGSLPHRYDALNWNGITVPSPLALKKTHERYAGDDGFYTTGKLPMDFPAPNELLLCCTTAGRDLLAWDTRNPDPARWLVINMHASDPEVLPGTLTELLVAELTMTHSGIGGYGRTPGDPRKWIAPFWGPDAP